MQKIKQSLLEASVNTAMGFIISVFVAYAVLPLYGMQRSFNYSLQVTLIFTVVSIVRNFAVRRLFNHTVHTTENERENMGSNCECVCCQRTGRERSNPECTSYKNIVQSAGLRFQDEDVAETLDAVASPIRPPHYVGKTGIKAIDVVEDFELNHRLSTAVEYILRSSKKHESPVDDLNKAIWFIEREVRNHEQ